MNLQHHNNTRNSLRSIPLIWSILGILCVGTTNAEVISAQPLESWEATPPKSGGEDDAYPGLIENPVGIDLILDTLVKYLIILLDAPLDNQTSFNGNTEPLKETADTLILGYPFFGLDPDLTSSEIEFGLDDAYSLIDILEKDPDGLSIDQDTQFELKATAEAIIEELEDGE